MIQTKVFLHGQHNYSLITGPTGPLVCAFLSKFLYPINMFADTQPVMSTFTKYYYEISDSGQGHTVYSANLWYAILDNPHSFLRNISLGVLLSQIGLYFCSHLANGYTPSSYYACSTIAGA